ncbi:unnamed protein product [Hyaloperonospora brassicae]|uniref:Midasin n=1 Tax=Hyaloperonospora brassicae TaxID=162125 RepID=A0AAV0THC7_HYABA|nr:unnamed protein product [Hyaloperonospora brassicae]
MTGADDQIAQRDISVNASRDSDNYTISVSRLRSGLQRMLAASPVDALKTHPALQLLATRPPVGGEHEGRLEIQALASCLAHAELRALIVMHLRPFLLDLVVRFIDPGLVLYEQLEQRTYSECCDTMKRVETVAATLAELLIVLPAGSTLVQQYFEAAPCFFAFADTDAALKQSCHETLTRLRRIAKTAFELLRPRPRELVPLWNWTPFFPLCFHDDTYIRWYAARATASILKLDSTQRTAFFSALNVGEEAAVSGSCPTVREIEIELYSEDATRQEQLIKARTCQQKDESDSALTQLVPLHDSLANIFGVVVPTSKLEQQRVVSEKTSVCTELVPTSSTKRILRSIAIALGLKRPILVAGPGGSGKTAMIRELSRLSGNDNVVELHLDDQIDSKTLLGSYVCTDVPGEFTWQPGALTTAVLTGRWVVIEDIDRAPFEVLAALMPLLETREMVLPGRGELLVAHPNFQLFGTTTHGHQLPKGFQESVWTVVKVAPLSNKETEQILLARFAKIPRQVISKVMVTYSTVSGSMNEEVGGSAHLWKETRRNYGRDFCLRDLLKWCKRIHRCSSYTAGATSHYSPSGHDYMTEDERMKIVVEALDVFCAGIRDPKTRLHSACAIAAIWEVQPDKIEHYLEQHKPHVAFNQHEVEFGRVRLPTLPQQTRIKQGEKPATGSVVMTGQVLRLLEKMAVTVATCEPALLIGETGCGKTTVIQHLAAAMGQHLVVQNLNIQSDSSDLVGGFQPVEIHLLARPLYMAFVDLFTATFSEKSNAGFLNVVRIALERKEWKKLVKGMRKAIQMAASQLQRDDYKADREAWAGTASNKTSTFGKTTSNLANRWDAFEAELVRFDRQKEQAESHFAFSFVEGALVKALRKGHWVLLDEINLASSDTLERIGTLLEHETSAFSITERGDVEVIRPHPNFRIFGAMNPSTDVGKKDLPPSLRNRFTEIYIDECVDRLDLQMVVSDQFREIAGTLVPQTVEFYLEARKQADLRLSDGARHKPRYSLRTLSQAMRITRILIQRGYGTPRAMFEGFCSSFCTQLESVSRQYLEKLIKNTFAKTMKSKDLTRSPPCPGGSKKTADFVLVSSYWLRKGYFQLPKDDSLPDPVTSRRRFVLTKSVEENLRHISRAALIGNYPVLLQGPTSAGKTSLIGYLAARIGQKCVRINNHDHTDIQEYLGSYVSDSDGKLAFKEGVLVEAIRKGWWIILDELNLAPSEVLEALNRLLDDNRELYVSETQEIVKPHPKFMLFATQNPPGLYGGRKVLSRAFRNRFLEIQIDEVAPSELQTILQERSLLPPSYCGILIDIMQQLQLVRQQSSVFAGKSGFITTRDLLRWADRRPATKQALAEEGYCLLAERLRKDGEKQIVKRVLEEKCNVKIDLDVLYYSGKPRESNLLDENGEIEQETVWGTEEQFKRVQAMVGHAIDEAASGISKNDGPYSSGNAAGLDKISLTKSLRRLFALVGRCLQNKEPVLLVGETGCGKTTVCQLFSLLFAQPLLILNCHQHSETSDFLGCLRPVRGKEKIAQELEATLRDFFTMRGECNDESKTEQRRAGAMVESLSAMLVKYQDARASALSGELTTQKELVEKIDVLKRRYQSIFQWADGPLVESMKNGDLILIDEVNLAEDAVLERLNSVLEPSRTLLLAEKGGDQVEEIVAHSKWRVMATMNPGGDFGKRELSPALRNRFTEIWVPPISDLDDITTIVRDKLIGSREVVLPAPGTQSMTIDALASLCGPILSFVKAFNTANGGVCGCGAVTLRDILSWVNFITSVVEKDKTGVSSEVTAWTAFVQGAALSILDGLGLGSDKALHAVRKAKEEAYGYLLALVPDDNRYVKEKVVESLNATTLPVECSIDQLNSFAADKVAEERFGIHPFFISRGPDSAQQKSSFSLKAPTTMSNLQRVLRAMQVSRPIILEGSPGVGKTSLISALAAASGHRLVRINLSEQTDISDLFGSDLPVAAGGKDGDEAGKGNASGLFEWCDGVFLRALKAGDWVLLDELNLASQSVLEGLNSCLDHRGSVYIPELDREFECPPTFRVFAAQNPLRQGGGRKGLPKSFLNRFTRVFVETLHEQDLIYIAGSMYPALHCAVVDTDSGLSDSQYTGKTLVERMVAFNRVVHEDTMVSCRYGRLGAPWEFNLRDVFRFCELLSQQIQAVDSFKSQIQAMSYYVNFIYVERMRSARDREFISRRFEELFGVRPTDLNAVPLRVSANFVEIGSALLARQGGHVNCVAPPIFNFLLKPMEALVHCVNMSWPALLVGPSASGKTSSVRLLAALSGNTLHELGMSAGTDATELLGCFEQADVGRQLRDIKQNIESVYEKVLQQLMLASTTGGITQRKRVATQNKFSRLCSSWWALCTRAKYHSDSALSRSHSEDGKKFQGKKLAKGQYDEGLVDMMKNIISMLTKEAGNEEMRATLAGLVISIDNVVRLSTSASIASCFEWVDGALIQAMERGHWVLLDNVNFCSSSVLDRLNSLMETGGEMLINECGIINGKLRIVRPHKNFRMFLAMDPQYGEVSRAMRNRCIEIALLEEDTHRLDLVKIALACGVPGFTLSQAFQTAHELVMNKLGEHAAGMKHGRINRRHLESWSSLASTELSRGTDPLNAIVGSFERVYGDGLLVQLDMSRDFLELFSGALKTSQQCQAQRALSMIATPSTLVLCEQSERLVLQRDIVYLEHLLLSLQRTENSGIFDAQLSWLTSDTSVVGSEDIADPHGVDTLDPWLREIASRLTRQGTSYSQRALEQALGHLPSTPVFELQNADTSLGVALAPFALRRIAEVTSTCGDRNTCWSIDADRLLFALEKIACDLSGNANAQSLVELLTRFLQSVTKTEMYADIFRMNDKTMRQLASLLDRSAGLPPIPAYLSANHAAFSNLQSLVAKRVASTPSLKTDLDSVWKSVLIGQCHLKLLSGTEWLRFCEQEEYLKVDLLCTRLSRSGNEKRSARGDRLESDLNDLSVLQQSYAVHKYQADCLNVENKLTFLVYPLLSAFDAFLVELNRDCSGLVTDALCFEAVEAALRNRYEFSIQLRVKTLEWTRFLIHWRWFKKSLLRLAKLIGQHPAGAFSWGSHWSALLDMSQRMQETIEKTVGCRSRKDVLWKKGGHSMLPSSADLWKAEHVLTRLSDTFMQHNLSLFSPLSVDASMGSVDDKVDMLTLLFGGVTSMEAAMKSGKLDVLPLFFVDVDSRKEVLHALCAFSYLALEQKQGKIVNATFGRRPNALSAELLKLPSILMKKLNDKKSEVTKLVSRKTLYLSEIEDNAGNHVDFLGEEDRRIGKDAPILLFDVKESASIMDQMVTFQLSPMIEHALARQELKSIAKLLHVLNMYRLCKHDMSQTRYTEIVTGISNVLKSLEGVIEEMMRLGLRGPASFYAYQDIVWCGHKYVFWEGSNETYDDKAVELEYFVFLAQSRLNGVLFEFHKSLRCNSYNQVDLISLNVFDTRKKMRKTNKGYSSVSTNAADHTHVIAGYPRLFQAVQGAVALKNIAEVNLEESTCPASEARMRAKRQEKIVSHFETKQPQPGTQMLNASKSFVQELFVVTVLAFESTFQEACTWKEIQSHLLQLTNGSRTLTAYAQTKLLKALRTSEDETFVMLVDVLVAPLVVSMVSEDQEQNAGHPPGAIGESMLLLGLWRFALLLPSSPVDPVTKPLVKRENLLSRLATLTLQDAASSSMHRLNPSPRPSTDSLEADACLMRELHSQVSELSADAIQRYQPTPPYSVAPDLDPNDIELRPVAASVFGRLFRDLLRFDATVMPAERMLTLVSTLRSPKLSQQRKREILRELENFQQTSESFLAQLSMKFGQSFRDILEPVVAAICCVKEGVALMAWSLCETLKNASLKTLQKEELALTLLQFPSSLSINKADQSWRRVQLMLQIIGTPATSLLFGPGVSNKRKVEVALLDVALSKMKFIFQETLATSRSYRALDSTAIETALQSSKSLFNLFLTKWQEQKDREEQKRKEEEEVFKYKVRQLDLETEEELLEKEFRKQFPDYGTRDLQTFFSSCNGAGDIESSAASVDTDPDMLITDSVMQRLCETHVKLYAEAANFEIKIIESEVVDAFAKAFSLAVKLRKSLNATLSTAVESAVASSGALAASLVQTRLGHSVARTKNDVPSFDALSGEYIKGIDFHHDPLVKEVVLVAEPLQRLMVKVQTLLAQWPDHAILQQIVLIADRIRNFEISSPLVRALTSVELLLRKAQEWEMYAARAYSISDELSALSVLVTRWRKLELYSWPHLLYVKEKQHRLMAQKTWIHMYSLLTAPFESDASGVDDSVIEYPQNLQWLYLNGLTKWLFVPLNQERADVQVLSDATRESRTKQREFMNGLFETLDAYIRSCPIGQYETRLLVVYSFCAQLLMELWSPSVPRKSSVDVSVVSSKHALASMLYHLCSYYGQHVGYLERHRSGLKAPIQRKLVEFVKICRWDEQTYYSLAESAEKSHRKLMKFVRDYDAVLTVSMQAIIDASTDSGISKEGGFVGIHSTKAELAGLDDGVVVPVDTGLDEERDPHEASLDEETTEGEKAKDKMMEKKLERPRVLRLTHASLPYVAPSEGGFLMPTSCLYAEKIPVLSKQISKFTRRHILSIDQVEHRQDVRTLCEDLCETIFYRMSKLQKATGLPKNAKKKALVDLLSEIRSQGMVYHRLQLPAELQRIGQLFELDVPDVDNCLHIDQLDSAAELENLSTASCIGRQKGKKKGGKTKSEQVGDVHQNALTEEALSKNSPTWLWQRADGYYYRFLGQLASLRYTASTSFSHDLSSTEINRMSGYAENMLHTMLQQRQILHATSLSHEMLVDGLNSLKLMKEFKNNYLMSGGNSRSAVDLQSASKWQSFQLASVVALRTCLCELSISVLQILQQSPTSASVVMEVRQQFQRISERCDVVQKSLANSAGLTRSLGVPAIPQYLVNARQDADGDVTSAAFAQSSKRVYGVSPAISRVGPSSGDSQPFPVSTEVLASNTAHFREISKFERTLNESSNISFSLRGDNATVEESAQSMATFSEHFDKLVETVLASIQDLTKLSKESNPGPTVHHAKEDEESATPSLRDQIGTLSTTVKRSRVKHIASHLAKLLDLLQDQYDRLIRTQSGEWKQVFVTSLTLLECFEPSLVDVRGISRQLLVDYLVAHKSVMKLKYVLVRVFRNLFQHGFCRTDNQENGDEDGGNAGKMQFQDDVEGTGMGEGEGKKDVSHEIEDEEQLLGLQGDQQEEPEPPADQQPDDTGLEMQNDFDGTMHDMPDEKEDDADENDDDREELDREMGEFGQDDENVVDEKMWGEDSDDDNDDIDKEEEKFEENSKVEGEALEDEVRGKDGDDEDEGDSNKEAEDKQKPQPDRSNDDDVDANDDDGEDAKMEDVVNDDFQDNYEDHHDVDPTEREDGHGEDKPEEEHVDDLPEDMQLDNDGDGGDDDSDVEGDNPDDTDMGKMDDVDDVTAEDELNEEGAGDAEEDKDAEEESEDVQLDNEVQLGGGGLEDDPEQGEEKEEDDAQQIDTPESIEKEQAVSTVAGTQSKDGQDELEADGMDAEDQDMSDANAQEEEQDQRTDDNSSSRTQKQSSNNNQNMKQEYQPQSQVDSDPNRERPREQRRNRREPNPYRNPQEAQEHWKKRVEMVDRTEEEDSDVINGSEELEKAAKEMTTAEFVDDDEEMENVEHALAATDESQVMNQPRAEEEDGEDVEKEEEAPNAENEASAMDVDEENMTVPADEQVQEDDSMSIKREPAPDSGASDEALTECEKQEDPKTKAEKRTGDTHELANEELEHVIPSKLRELDLTTTMSLPEEGDDAEVQTTTLLSPDEVAALREELDSFIATWSSQSEQERGAELWAKYTALTAGASQRLCEQLRLVLEPMLRAKLEGDYRTGKRINMRKVIPYIASQFRKDKIWLRRTRPSKRQYQVMLAIDDSESMADNHAGRLALEALATLCKGMTQLEVGELAIAKFGHELELLHAFDMPFTDDAGSRVISRFGFQQKKTNMVHTLDTILQLLEMAKQAASTASSAAEFTQIVFLISDGRFDSDGRVRIRKLIETALERQQLIVLLVVDQGAAEGVSSQQQTSILDTQSVTFVKGKVRMVPYLENYPFPYYVLLPTSTMLPEILSDSLRQWFEMLQAKT